MTGFEVGAVTASLQSDDHCSSAWQPVCIYDDCRILWSLDCNLRSSSNFLQTKSIGKLVGSCKSQSHDVILKDLLNHCRWDWHCKLVWSSQLLIPITISERGLPELSPFQDLRNIYVIFIHVTVSELWFKAIFLLSTTFYLFTLAVIDRNLRGKYPRMNSYPHVIPGCPPDVISLCLIFSGPSEGT